MLARMTSKGQVTIPREVRQKLKLEKGSLISFVLKEEGRGAELKVVAQSAHALSGDRARFLEEGYDEYLPKPFTALQLEEIITGLANK